MRHRLLTTTAVLALVPAGAVIASPPHTTTGDSADTMPATTLADDGSVPASSAPATSAAESMTPETTQAPAAPVVVTIFDGDREPVAIVTAHGAVLSWTDYSEDDTPDEGNHYVRATVFVESTTTGDDSFSISVDHFVLQDEHGALTRGENIRTAAQADADEDAIGDAELAAGESIELHLTFEIPAGVQPWTIYYLHEDRLFYITDVETAAALSAA